MRLPQLEIRGGLDRADEFIGAFHRPQSRSINTTSGNSVLSRSPTALMFLRQSFSVILA